MSEVHKVCLAIAFLGIVFVLLSGLPVVREWCYRRKYGWVKHYCDVCGMRLWNPTEGRQYRSCGCRKSSKMEWIGEYPPPPENGEGSSE